MESKSEERVLNAKVSGSGEAVLLLHGLFGTGDNLGRLAAALSPMFEVHSLDLRNHGRSFHDKDMDYEVMAADVIHYMDRHEINTARLVGHSMGGKVAMAALQRNPNRFDAVVVADIAPVEYTAHHQSIFEGLWDVERNDIKSRQEADKRLSAYILEASVRQFLLKNLVKVADGHYRWKMNLAAIYNNYKNILSGLPALAPVDKPVLFIAGAQSDYILPQYGEKIQELFPTARVKVIPETGHWLHAEKPDLFNSVCKRFLTGKG